MNLRVGRQIIFPTEQELKDKYHAIDYDVAKFFYEVINYYPEFETAFNRDSAEIILKMSECRKDRLRAGCLVIDMKATDRINRSSAGRMFLLLFLLLFGVGCQPRGELEA